MCPSCSAPLAALALSCPSCRHLIHARELEALSQQAKLAEGAGALADARVAWARALTLLPPGTLQYAAVSTRLIELDKRLQTITAQPSKPAANSVWARRFEIGRASCRER